MSIQNQLDPFIEERRQMVEVQLRGRGIRDERVLEAMGRVPRHLFVPRAARAKAYEDKPLPIDCGQTISQPYMVAIMTELLELRPTDRVLELGTGSGYQAAILTELASTVLTIERHGPLAESARARLSALGHDNVQVECGDGSLGYSLDAPYDGIIVTAGAPDIPGALVAQLAPRGRLVCPVGSREAQTLVQITRRGEGTVEKKGTACMFVPLIGERGWAE
jgi:protein-L-isoaspartate(D-aspartate) O-methyltransferase